MELRCGRLLEQKKDPCWVVGSVMESSGEDHGKIQRIGGCGHWTLVMLILTRRIGEEVVINENIRVTVLHVRGKAVRIGVTAPASVSIVRQEIHALRADLDAESSRPCEGDPPMAIRSQIIERAVLSESAADMAFLFG